VAWILEETAHWAPWWAWLIVVLTCVTARTCTCIYKQQLLYRFADKALEKARQDQVPAIVTAVTRRDNSTSPPREIRDDTDCLTALEPLIRAAARYSKDAEHLSPGSAAPVVSK
jgi:hypothetical protein